MEVAVTARWDTVGTVRVAVGAGCHAHGRVVARGVIAPTSAIKAWVAQAVGTAVKRLIGADPDPNRVVPAVERICVTGGQCCRKKHCPREENEFLFHISDIRTWRLKCVQRNEPRRGGGIGGGPHFRFRPLRGSRPSTVRMAAAGAVGMAVAVPMTTGGMAAAPRSRRPVMVRMMGRPVGGMAARRIAIGACRESRGAVSVAGTVNRGGVATTPRMGSVIDIAGGKRGDQDDRGEHLDNFSLHSAGFDAHP